jgi:hypothetical protein
VPEIAVLRLRNFVFQVSVVPRKSVCQNLHFVVCQRNLHGATPFRNRQEGITLRHSAPKFLFAVKCENYSQITSTLAGAGTSQRRCISDSTQGAFHAWALSDCTTLCRSSSDCSFVRKRIEGK